MNSRGAGLPPFVRPISPLNRARSPDTAILIAAACVAIALTGAICFATAPTSPDDLTNFAAAATIG
jgi:hypothetical protein